MIRLNSFLVLIFYCSRAVENWEIVGIDQQQNGTPWGTLKDLYVKLHLYPTGHPSCLLKFVKAFFVCDPPPAKLGGPRSSRLRLMMAAHIRYAFCSPISHHHAAV